MTIRHLDFIVSIVQKKEVQTDYQLPVRLIGRRVLHENGLSKVGMPPEERNENNGKDYRY